MAKPGTPGDAFNREPPTLKPKCYGAGNGTGTGKAPVLGPGNVLG